MLVQRRALLGAMGVTALARSAPLSAGDAPPLLPIEVFASKPTMDDLVLSPDGTRVLARMLVRGKEMLGTYVIATGELKAFSLPEESDLAWYRWAGNDRILVSVASVGRIRQEVSSIMTYWAEGRGTKLFVYDVASQQARFIGLKAGGMIGDNVVHVDPAGEYLLLAVRPSLVGDWSIYRITLNDNRATRLERGIGGVYQWYADDKGVVRASIGATSAGWFFAYRGSPAEPLRQIARGQFNLFERELIGAMSFVSGTDEGYVITKADNGLNAVFRFNFATRAIGEQVFASPTNDVQALQFDAGNTLEAIHYVDDRPRIHWVEPLMKEIQDGIDRAMPGRQNRIVGRSDDKAVLLVHSSTTRDPGTYYVFHLSNSKLSKLVKANERLVASQLATMEPVRYRARDMLEIPGYLTLPSGREAKGLPLVILPHGGPYGVRDTLGFDPVVQFLANRGYAVLQPNYRGSESYGVEFFKRGQGEWGRKMQDDLDDGMDWLIGRGIVDARRACIVGGSYGGYAAAWGATRNPERYRCAVCFAGVFDLRKQLGYAGDFLLSRLYRQYRDTVRGAETFDLDSVSPLLAVDRLSVPVMLVHGDKDSVVPISQSRAYAAALAKAGKSHEFHTIKDEGHGLGQEGSLAFYLGKLEAFLKAHNPAV